MKVEFIPVDKIYVSPLNVRAEEEFGTAPEDEALQRNVERADIKQLITVRPKGDQYEVILGRRRFLAIKDRVKKIPCIVRDDWDDREAIKASLIENLEIFHKSLDPIARANALNRLISMSPTGMTGVARELGIPKSNLSEYLKVLELSPKMQELVAKGPGQGIPFRYAVRVARLGLGQELQDSLAETFETQGAEAFRSEVKRLGAGEAKRGAPAGLLVVRVVFDHRYKPDVETYEAYIEHCKALGVEPDERCKFLISEDVKATRAQASG